MPSAIPQLPNLSIMMDSYPSGTKLKLTCLKCSTVFHNYHCLLGNKHSKHEPVGDIADSSPRKELMIWCLHCSEGRHSAVPFSLWIHASGWSLKDYCSTLWGSLLLNPLIVSARTSRCVCASFLWSTFWVNAQCICLCFYEATILQEPGEWFLLRLRGQGQQPMPGRGIHP